MKLFIINLIICHTILGFNKVDLSKLEFNEQIKFIIKASKKKRLNNQHTKVNNKSNIKQVEWTSIKEINDIDFLVSNSITVEYDSEKVLKYHRVFKKREKQDKTLFRIIKFKLISYLIKFNNLLILQYISNSYCHCNILRSDIKKEQYNSGVIYSIHKSFPTRDKNFKIKNDFKINIFETGSIIDFSWNRSGKRVAPNNKKK